jgi:DNA-binding response OmpR family regulator
LVHEDYFKNNSKVKNLNEINKIKILVCNSLNHNIFKFSDKLTLPTSVKVINQIVENSITKKNFNNNSSIKIKNYNLDKNEKKLTKNENFVLLTEKEIQLLELLLKTDEAISRDEILSKVWKYASQADTHTVETHIYRLRKKIKTKFADENFILNDKKGYSL